MKKLLLILLISLTSVLCGCQNTKNNVNDERITVGTVQKNIKIGMTSTEVLEILGSPNIVTNNSNGGETWVYDKISTEVTKSSSESGLWLIIVGAGSSRKNTSSTQRTLTIIIKFDKDSRVSDFSYRTSTF